MSKPTPKNMLDDILGGAKSPSRTENVAPPKPSNSKIAKTHNSKRSSTNAQKKKQIITYLPPVTIRQLERLKLDVGDLLPEVQVSRAALIEAAVNRLLAEYQRDGEGSQFLSELQ